MIILFVTFILLIPNLTLAHSFVPAILPFSVSCSIFLHNTDMLPPGVTSFIQIHSQNCYNIKYGLNIFQWVNKQQHQVIEC